MASDGKNLNKGVESDDQTLSFNITGVYCSDGETEEGKEKILMADPTVAYELQESVNENDEIEQTVGYELMEERSEEKNDITIDHTPKEESNGEGMIDPTVQYGDIEIDKRNDKGSKDIGDVAGSENGNESKDISNKGSEDIGDVAGSENGNESKDISNKGSEDIGDLAGSENGNESKDISNKGSEDISNKGSEDINGNESKDISNKGSEDINGNGPEIIGSEGINDVEPTVPYVINDNEETDSGTTTCINEHKITNVRYSTRKGNGTKCVKGPTPAGRGRGRRGKVPISEELPMEVTDSDKNEDDNKETEPSLPVRGLCNPIYIERDIKHYLSSY